MRSIVNLSAALPAIALVGLTALGKPAAAAEPFMVVCVATRPSGERFYLTTMRFLDFGKVATLSLPMEGRNFIILLSSMRLGKYEINGSTIQIRYVNQIQPGIDARGLKNELRPISEGERWSMPSTERGSTVRLVALNDGKSLAWRPPQPKNYTETCTRRNEAEPDLRDIVQAGYINSMPKFVLQFGPNLYGAEGTTSQPAASNVGVPTYRYEPAIVELQGIFASLPGESPNGNRIQFPALVLNRPITVAGNGVDPPEADVDKLHLVLNEQLMPAFSKLKGSKVTVTGTLFHADNGNHQTRVLMNATKISP